MLTSQIFFSIYQIGVGPFKCASEMKDLKTDLDVSRRRYFDLRPDLDVHLPRKRLFLLPFFVQERGNGNLDVKLQAVRL